MKIGSAFSPHINLDTLDTLETPFCRVGSLGHKELLMEKIKTSSGKEKEAYLEYFKKTYPINTERLVSMPHYIGFDKFVRDIRDYVSIGLIDDARHSVQKVVSFLSYGWIESILPEDLKFLLK